MQRHLCTLSRMLGLSTLNTFYSQDICIQQSRTVPLVWIDHRGEHPFLIPGGLPARVLSTIHNWTISNFPYLISMLVFLELSSLCVGFLIYNFSMHLEVYTSHFVSSVFPFHIPKNEGQELVWASHFGENCGAGISEPFLYYQIFFFYYCQFFPLGRTFFPTRIFFWKMSWLFWPKKRSECFCCFVSPSLYKTLQELVAHYYYHYC